MRKIKYHKDGVIRFNQNDVVRYLYDQAAAGIKCDLNDLWMALLYKKFSRAQLREFYQLIGYSVSGYGDIFTLQKR